MSNFLRGWWAVILFCAICVYAADRVWRVGQDKSVATVEMSGAIRAWADAGAKPHGEAAREMERLMNNGF